MIKLVIFTFEQYTCMQGSYSNKEMRFQYIPVYSRMDRTQFPGHFWCGISHKHIYINTFISAHPHNGHKSQYKQFALYGICSTESCGTLKFDHICMSSQSFAIFFANEACSSSFSFADRRYAFDFMILILASCRSAPRVALTEYQCP